MPFKMNVINPEYKRNVTLQQPHHYLCPGLSCQIPHKELSALTRVLPFKALGRPVPRHPREGPVHTVLLFRFVWLVSHKLDGPLQRDFKVKWASIRSSKGERKKTKTKHNQEEQTAVCKLLLHCLYHSNAFQLQHAPCRAVLERICVRPHRSEGICNKGRKKVYYSFSCWES